MVSEFNPLLSIIVPFFNAEEYLEVCVCSIINNDFNSEYELILINDNSTDSSKKLAIEIREKYSFKNIRVFDNDKSGVSSARNFGIGKARGKYVTFIDADDVVNSSYLGCLVSNLNKYNPDMLFFGFSELKYDKKNLHSIDKKFVGNEVSSNVAIESLFSHEGHMGFCWNKVYKKKILKKIRFNTKIYYLEDLLFNVQVLNEVKSILSISDRLYLYKWRKDSMVNGYSEKQLTYLYALDLIEKIIPNKFLNKIYLKKKLAYISFSAKLPFKYIGYITEFKKGFLKISNVDTSDESLSKSDSLILKISQINYYIGIFLFKIKRNIIRTKIYAYLRSK